MNQNEQDNCQYCNGKGYVNENHGSPYGSEKVNCICMNKQDNNPERTAMQEHIEYLQKAYHSMGESSRNAISMAIRNAEKLRDTVEKEREERAATIIQDLMVEMNGNGYHWLTSYKAAKVFIEKHTNHGK